MFRNKEVRRFAVWFIIAAIAAVIAGFSVCPAAGGVSIGFSAVFGVLFYGFTRARYARIAEIAEQIDLVLHNDEHLYISESGEGELSILQSEVTKMMLRIREQNEALKREKEHLADSLADIAHQLRTPLTAVNLILSLLEKETDVSRRKMLAREAEELFAQMDWLLTSLLKLSRLDAGIVAFRRGKVAVDRMVRSALRPLLISMELHDIAVETDVPDGMVIEGDLEWLSEAVQNILKNCMQSVGNGGKIEITCVDTPLYGQLTVHDSGPGFQQEDLPRLFERFYRGKKDAAAGYGIGLALCRMIITRQGGTVTACNHPRGGALFVIRFPK